MKIPKMRHQLYVDLENWRYAIQRYQFVVICILSSIVFTVRGTCADNPEGADLQFYETKVLPILREHCLECHSHESGKAKGGLVLDSRQALLIGGDSGPAVLLKDVDKSRLTRAVIYDSDELQMPPDGKISDDQIKVLKEWIRRKVPAPESSPSLPHLQPLRKTGKHWAFQPLQQVVVPVSISPGIDVIDHLIDQARDAEGVKSVAPAEKRNVVKRLYLDLIGLPPSPEKLNELIQGDAQSSIEAIVESLLKMPEFGERWGRHWLDVARYADSNGCASESNHSHDNAWRYRDYVIASLNDDKPYDQFVFEQIAGDLLDYVSTTQRCEQLVATGFLLMGPKAFGTRPYELFRLAVIDEQIDTVGKAMLGLSLGCARCHDHKFDPVSTKDYYALAGIFASTDSVHLAKGWPEGKSWNRVRLPVLDPEAEVALEKAHELTRKDAKSGELKKRAELKLKQAEEVLKKIQTDHAGTASAILDAEEAVEAARRNVKNASNMANVNVMVQISPVPVAMAVVDMEKPVDEAVRVRGIHNNRGEVVPRSVLSLFDSEQFPVPGGQSGRLQLAQYLVDTDRGAGSLLARVAVNRIWGHLFARPLVASADNFGLTGESPSHSELLDYLATRFIKSDWSVKRLIRDIVLTRTYQLAAVENVENLQHDPANVWLWRYEPKRIDVEVLRDSMLAMTGRLDSSRGGKTLQYLGRVSSPGARLTLSIPSSYRRRSVYLPIYRDALGLTPKIDASMGMLATFDFANANVVTGLRPQTVVPGQALFLMNSEFVYQQSKVMADNLLSQPELKDDTQRLERLFTIVYGRSISTEESSQLEEYIATFTTMKHSTRAQPNTNEATRQLAWTSLCQSIFGSNEFLFQD